MASRRKKTAKSCSLYPDLHDRVETLLKEDDLSLAFHPVDDNETAIKWYSTCVMGRFVCHKASCSSNGWSSKKIAIRIRMYAGGRYNARIYHQRCQQCNSLSRPKLDAESYAERVSYRLKKWSDVDVKPPPYGGKKGEPHRRELCEGCKVDDCEEGRLEVMMAGLDISWWTSHHPQQKKDSPTFETPSHKFAQKATDLQRGSSSRGTTVPLNRFDLRNPEFAALKTMRRHELDQLGGV